MTIQGIYGNRYDQVLVDGAELDPIHSQLVYNHNPDGFAWGHAGSGPAQLALAILLYAGVDKDDALLLHQSFKKEFIEWVPVQGDWMLIIDIWDWVHHRLLNTTAEPVEGVTHA